MSDSTQTVQRDTGHGASPVARQALTLHLTSGSEPILIALGDDAGQVADTLARRLQTAQVETVTAANGAQFVVNFARVVAAHVDTAPPLGQLYGSQRRA